MKEVNLLKIVEKKLFTVNKSYHESFKELTEEELIGLCKYDSLLEKVHKELESKVSQEDIKTFEHSLMVYRDLGDGFSKLYTSVFKKEASNPAGFFENLILKKTVTSSDEFNPIYSNLINKAEQDSWVKAKGCLYENSEVLNPNAVTRLTNGFALENVTSYDRFLEAITSVAGYIKDIITFSDFSHVLNLCKTNEKFVFILLYPYLIKPLGNIVWTTLLPHFHFVSGSFLTFIKHVSDLLKSDTLSKTFVTLSLKKSTKLALGAGGVGILALFSNAFVTKTQQASVSNGRLYQGLSGNLGYCVSLFRLHGSKVIYEMAKTLSTFSSAAFAGAIEPKQEAISNVLSSSSSFVSELVKKIKK